MTKTGIEILGPPLFADMHAGTKVLRRLPQDVITYLDQLRHALPAASADELKQNVQAHFAVEPLVIGELRSIRIEAFRRDFLNDYDCWMTGHLHQAEVTYSGNALFWRLQSITPNAFDYRGKIGAASVRLRTYIDSEDYYGFRDNTGKALRFAREMLAMTYGSQLLLAEQAHDLVEKILKDALPA